MQLMSRLEALKEMRPAIPQQLIVTIPVFQAAGLHATMKRYCQKTLYVNDDKQ
jgi:hypothetical protein